METFIKSLVVKTLKSIYLRIWPTATFLPDAKANQKIVDEDPYWLYVIYCSGQNGHAGKAKVSITKNVERHLAKLYIRDGLLLTSRCFKFKVDKANASELKREIIKSFSGYHAMTRSRKKGVKVQRDWVLEGGWSRLVIAIAVQIPLYKGSDPQNINWEQYKEEQARLALLRNWHTSTTSRKRK